MPRPERDGPSQWEDAEVGTATGCSAPDGFLQCLLLAQVVSRYVKGKRAPYRRSARGSANFVGQCQFATSWDQPEAVFCRVMGPPLLQAEGTTRGGGLRRFLQPHGTRHFAGSWDHPVTV
jgi:hypothetical protein